MTVDHPKISSRARFARASRASIVRDVSMDAWKLELWDDGTTALGLWPITDIDDFSDTQYQTVRELLANVGVLDEGREGWSKVEGNWMSPVHAFENETHPPR